MNDDDIRLRVFGYKMNDTSACVTCVREILLGLSESGIDKANVDNPLVDIHGLPMDAKDNEGDLIVRIHDPNEAGSMTCVHCSNSLVPEWALDLLNGVTVGTQEQCEAAEYVACIRVSEASGKIDGALTVKCCICDRDIYLSPHSPVKPKKICIQCAVEEGERKQRKDEESGEITE